MEKRFTLKIPESYSPLEMIALTLGLMVIFSLWFHAKKINPEKDMQKRSSLYVVCCALNEFMAIVAFSAVVISESGNGFVYLTNFSLAFVGNLLTYPKEKVYFFLTVGIFSSILPLCF